MWCGAEVELEFLGVIRITGVETETSFSLVYRLFVIEGANLPGCLRYS